MKKLLKEWQHRLGLDDWHIALNANAIPSDFEEPDRQGECTYGYVGKDAMILILDEKYYGKRVVPQDKEKTLVHELLHCKFCLLNESENPLQNMVVHQLIDDLAKAFVKAKRGE